LNANSVWLTIGSSKNYSKIREVQELQDFSASHETI